MASASSQAASEPTRFSGRVESFTTISVEAEVGVGREDQVVDLQALRLHLLLGAEDVRVVLRKAAHAQEPVQRAGRLVAVHRAELGETQRQVAVALQPVLEDLDVPRAVHRLQHVEAIVVVDLVAGRLHLEHVFAERAPVARCLPQHLVEHLRRVHFLVVFAEPPAHVGDELLEHGPAVRVPEDDARPLLLEMEQIHLAAEAAMVALFRFLEHGEVALQFVFGVPGRAIDAGQLRVARIAPPIGAGDLHQLERRADLPGRGHMRPAAEIEPVALPVNLDLLVRRDRVDQLDLEHLALVGEHVLHIVPRPHLLREGAIALDDLAHLRLDLRQVVGGERLVPEEVVVEAVFDHRADGHLRAGVKLLHRLGHHVRRVVANKLERARIVARHDLDPGVLVDLVGKVGEISVEGHRHRLLGKRL